MVDTAFKKIEKSDYKKKNLMDEWKTDKMEKKEQGY